MMRESGVKTSPFVLVLYTKRLRGVPLLFLVLVRVLATRAQGVRYVRFGESESSKDDDVTWPWMIR